jgi:hypothetical protein
MNRRDFLKGIFGGGIVLGTGAGGKLVMDGFVKNETYTGPESYFNIWVVENRQWKLLSDSFHAPYEFSSFKKAEAYARKFLKESAVEHDYGLPTDRYTNHSPSYPHNNWARPDGTWRIKPCPTEVRFIEHLNHDIESAAIKAQAIAEETGESLFSSYYHLPYTLRDGMSSRDKRRSLVFTPYVDPAVLVIASILTAKTGGEAAQIWCSSLGQGRGTKKKIIKLSKSPTFNDMLENLYCHRSFHAEQAKLQTFYPARLTIRA